MKPEQQRIKIAEACGWTRPFANTDWKWHDPSGKMHEDWGKELSCPDYLDDLNAMRDAEEVILKQGLQDVWLDNLVEAVAGKNIHWSDYHCFPQVNRASAAHRAEAFLKTLGLWMEDQL